MNLAEHLSQDAYKKYELKLVSNPKMYETKTVRFYNEGIAILTEDSSTNQEIYHLIPFPKIEEIWCHK